MMKAWLKRGCAVMLLCLCIVSVFCLQSSAQSIAVQPISPALQVLAGTREMAVATLCGNDYYFSEEVFARTLNLSRVGSITVTALPAVTAGELLMGSERVSIGQRIAAKDLRFCASWRRMRMSSVHRSAFLLRTAAMRWSATFTFWRR
jgi:hypothetical protein